MQCSSRRIARKLAASPPSRNASARSRKAATRSDRKKPRLRSSARQKGAIAAVLCAGITITSLCVMRMMRQLWAPSEKVSPSERSQTNSSSSSPSLAMVS